MEPQDLLMSAQYRLLERVANGEFGNTVAVPDEMHDLLVHGYVERIPTVLFPNMPSRYNYHLTRLGGDMLEKCRARMPGP